MQKRAVLLSSFLFLACHSGEVAPAGSGGTGAPTFGGGAGGVVAGGSGGSTAGPGPTGGYPGAGGSNPVPMADASAMSVDAGACPFSMAGTACGPAGANCVFNSDCVARRCDCQNGTWACSERQIPCGGTCPAPQAAQCGDSCTGNVSGCLCHCGGGGPNYSGCSCTAGRWTCGCGH